ncbi:serine/threonine-protein kinase [Pseudomarimonas arenosa]|uniref:Serine/threonine protein kinase n=1 Tax=Pseudomarimonas arenosa TaxID=2774145 RepID=A0AAW3ZMS1_9GAMM|nr:serine/threonine-protein kinase [Pseudomarimonas arenosa]MBD8526464.1 serine/threonine protein kinase [Pseudomarimonas arenosa]
MQYEDGDKTDLLALTERVRKVHKEDKRTLSSGTCFGRYRIEALIGEGGMGAVYLATQTEPVKRSVAIKVCLERRLEDEDLSRFLVERQVLARMSHPAIAQLLDAGTLDDGTPFFVMEYVAGDRVTRFVRQRQLTVEQRIQLFCEFCHGVEHAHRRGVIHCDLKPSNLLVTEVEGRLQPKVIDFGIARAMAHESTQGTSAGTPGYMSPEQASGMVDLDTRTDVFSLGVLLYELLAERPFAQADAAAAPALEQRLLAFAGDAGRPELHSLKLSGLARSRWRELDAIVNRATAGAREQRYGSTAQLAEDLQLWLRREAIPAYSSSWIYRGACVLRRHALLATISGLALLSIAVLGAQLVAQYQEVSRQRDVAEETSRLLLSTFQAADPYTYPGASISVRELLIRSAGQVMQKPLEPTIKLRLLSALADVQANLELWDDVLVTRMEAEKLSDSAGVSRDDRADFALQRLRAMVDLEQWDEAANKLDRFASRFDLPPTHPLVLESQILRVEIWEATDQADRSAQLLRELEPLVRASDKPELRYRWARFRGRAAVLAQDGERALAPLNEAYRLAVDFWGEDDARTAATLSDLALAEALAGNLDQAEQHRRAIVAFSERLFGGDSVGLAVDLSNLGAFLQRRGERDKLVESVAVYQRALDIFRQRSGESSVDTATAANGLASALESLGEFDRASAAYRQAADAMRAARGDQHSLVGIVLHNWGRNELQAGRLASAERLLSESAPLLEQGLGKDHPRYAIWRHTMARLRLAQGERVDALVLIKAALPVLVAAYGEDSTEVKAGQATENAALEP